MKRIAKFLCFCGLVVLLAACNPKLTKTSFDSISTGMTLEDVTAILGQPSSSATLGFGQNSVATVRWENRNLSIVIQFINGRVKIKQFVEGVSTPRVS